MRSDRQPTMNDPRALTPERLAAIRNTIERSSTIGQKMARELILAYDAAVDENARLVEVAEATICMSQGRPTASILP